MFEDLLVGFLLTVLIPIFSQKCCSLIFLSYMYHKSVPLFLSDQYLSMNGERNNQSCFMNNLSMDTRLIGKYICRNHFFSRRLVYYINRIPMF